MSTPDKLTTLLHRPSRQPWARLQTRFQTHKERRSLIWDSAGEAKDGVRA
jgi:hypothetical protein